jgi:precorrin-6x reductase
MPEIVIFGGTTEGRQLAAHCGRAGVPALVCVATPLGEEAAGPSAGVDFRVGRLGLPELTDLLRQAKPRLVIDATHPYAAEVTRNVRAAAGELGLRLIRVARAGAGDDPDVRRFPDLDSLVAWLNTTTGIIFSTTGAKEARALTGVAGFADRVYLRLLPVAEGIAECLALGYPTAHLIALQGPFGADLNAALFRHTGASILVTKDSGDVGGVADKLRAARSCGLAVAMVDRPGDIPGVGVQEACRLVGLRVG